MAENDLCMKAMALLVGPIMMVIGVALMLAYRDQTQNPGVSPQPSLDFVFLGPLCMVEQIDWRAIIDEGKNMQTCRDGYTCVSPPVGDSFLAWKTPLIRWMALDALYLDNFLFKMFAVHMPCRDSACHILATESPSPHSKPSSLFLSVDFNY